MQFKYVCMQIYMYVNLIIYIKNGEGVFRVCVFAEDDSRNLITPRHDWFRLFVSGNCLINCCQIRYSNRIRYSVRWNTVTWEHYLHYLAGVHCMQAYWTLLDHETPRQATRAALLYKQPEQPGVALNSLVIMWTFSVCCIGDFRTHFLTEIVSWK